MEEKTNCGYAIKSAFFFFQYILIKEFQVLYGNCFFKYPKQKASLVKLCICKQAGKHNRQQTHCKATEELSSPGATAVTAEPERTHYHIRLLSELSAGSDSLLVNGEAGNRAVGSAGCCPRDLAARQKALPKFKVCGNAVNTAAEREPHRDILIE